MYSVLVSYYYQVVSQLLGNPGGQPRMKQVIIVGALGS